MRRYFSVAALLFVRIRKRLLLWAAWSIGVLFLATWFIPLKLNATGEAFYSTNYLLLELLLSPESYILALYCAVPVFTISSQRASLDRRLSVSVREELAIEGAVYLVTIIAGWIFIFLVERCGILLRSTYGQGISAALNLAGPWKKIYGKQGCLDMDLTFDNTNPFLLLLSASVSVTILCISNKWKGLRNKNADSTWLWGACVLIFSDIAASSEQHAIALLVVCLIIAAVRFCGKWKNLPEEGEENEVQQKA